jgi:glutamate/tyrosine decarboxylase-like PLP-dependent enzyme
MPESDPLDPSPDQIREMGAAAVDAVAEYLSTLAERPIFPVDFVDGLPDRLGKNLPVEGAHFSELLATVTDVVFQGSRQNGHPRMFGYVNSPGSATSAYADLLASALNSNVTAWRSAPAATEVERITIDWIRQILSMPPGTSGLFVSGGSMANMSGLAAARDAKANLNVTQLGAQALTQPLCVYASTECHFSIQKACGILGIGRANVRQVRVDAAFKIENQALERAILEDLESGCRPICIVGNAGTVGTGAIDDLVALADMAKKYGLWFHVDGSYGGFGALAPSKRSLFGGLARADSVALDPHKWLYLPVDCGCILYRDPARAKAVFGHDAEYTRVMEEGERESYAFWDYGPELSRRFRALKVWMMLKHAGTRALGEAIERNCACAEYLANMVEESDDFEMLAPVELSIFCFRHVRPGLSEPELDALNESLLKRLQRAGSSYLSNARIHRKFALRGCVLNYRTTERDMKILLEDCRRAATG